MVDVELLARFDIFDSLSPDLAAEIAASAQVAPYAPGEVIVPFGAPFTFFGLLLEGEACAYLGEGSGPQECIEVLD